MLKGVFRILVALYLLFELVVRYARAHPHCLRAV
jgi:hypothetical protein